MTATGRTHFDKLLQRLEEMVLELGSLSQAALSLAMKALVEGDRDQLAK
jgi:hypothetical protein